MPDKRAWSLQTVIDMGLPPVPEDAPPSFKARYSGLVQAFANGHCPECLVDLVVVSEPGRPWNVSMAHLAGCPYSIDCMQELVDELGLTASINPRPPSVVVDRELFEAIEDLEIDPYL